MYLIEGENLLQLLLTAKLCKAILTSIKAK